MYISFVIYFFFQNKQVWIFQEENVFKKKKKKRFLPTLFFSRWCLNHTYFLFGLIGSVSRQEASNEYSSTTYLCVQF